MSIINKVLHGKNDLSRVMKLSRKCHRSRIYNKELAAKKPADPPNRPKKKKRHNNVKRQK
jgi:hypothetical protein